MDWCEPYGPFSEVHTRLVVLKMSWACHIYYALGRAYEKKRRRFRDGL